VLVATLDTAHQLAFADHWIWLQHTASD